MRPQPLAEGSQSGMGCVANQDERKRDAQKEGKKRANGRETEKKDESKGHSPEETEAHGKDIYDVNLGKKITFIHTPFSSRARQPFVWSVDPNRLSLRDRPQSSRQRFSSVHQSEGKGRGTRRVTRGQRSPGSNPIAWTAVVEARSVRSIAVRPGVLMFMDYSGGGWMDVEAMGVEVMEVVVKAWRHGGGVMEVEVMDVEVMEVVVKAWRWGDGGGGDGCGGDGGGGEGMEVG
ncbi:unnamed protein product [Boreogadus saida]